MMLIYASPSKSGNNLLNINVYLLSGKFNKIIKKTPKTTFFFMKPLALKNQRFQEF